MLAYFAHTIDSEPSVPGYEPVGGTLHFYNRVDGTTCGFSNSEYDRYAGDGHHRFFNTWLSDSRFVALSPAGDVLSLITPCNTHQTIELPELMRSIDACSPYRDTLLLHSEEAIYIFTLDDGSIRLVEGISDFLSARANVSLDGTYFVMTLSNPGSTLRVDIDTLEILYLYEDVEGLCCGYIFAPYWLNDDLILIAVRDSPYQRIVYADGSGEYQLLPGEGIGPTRQAVRQADGFVLIVRDIEDNEYIYFSNREAVYPLEPFGFYEFAPDGAYLLRHTNNGAVYIQTLNDNLGQSNTVRVGDAIVDISYTQDYFVVGSWNSAGIHLARGGYQIAAVGFGHLVHYEPFAWTQDGQTFALTAYSRRNALSDTATVLMLVTVETVPR